MECKFNENLPEPELITKSRRILNIIQAVLIGFRVIIILFYGILSTMGADIGEEPLKLLIEIGVISIFLDIIKSGKKQIAILPLLGGIKSIVEVFSLSDSSIIVIFMSCYLAVMGFFQILSMGYILFSKKIEFYCNYVLYNKNN
ncbi:hypothetical protein UT300005_00230 [Clostridium sp. CTA-5]